jgi:hypothetical protein
MTSFIQDLLDVNDAINANIFDNPYRFDEDMSEEYYRTQTRIIE